MLDWSAILTLLAFSHSAYCWTLGNVKDDKGRSLPSPVTGNLPDDTNPSEYLQDWLNEEIDLQRRADEELQAAEIASAEEEYERIKYNIELQRRNSLNPSIGEVKRADDGFGMRSGHGEGHELDAVKRSGQVEGHGLNAVKTSVEGHAKRSGQEHGNKQELDGHEVQRQRKAYGHKMGIPDKFCDDGKLLLENDWDPKDPANTKDYTCNSSILQPAQQTFQDVCVRPKKPTHKCMKTILEKQTEPPVLGSHRPLWAKYGKYLYLPWQRWLHNLEHGAIGLLYHKCADPEQVESFEGMVTGCMRKHIITPYDLPPEKPFALVSWGCYLYMTHFDKKVVFDFIKQHALHGRENFARANGQYSELLVQPAEIASDYEDIEICPKKRFPEMYNLFSLDVGDDNTEDDLTGLGHLKDIPVKQSGPRHPIGQKSNMRHKRDVDWLRSTNQNAGSDVEASDWSELTNGNITPELAKEGEISKLEEEEETADVEREAKIAELEKEEDIARLERESDIAHLQRDLHAIKRLFNQKVKPLMHN